MASGAELLDQIASPFCGQADALELEPDHLGGRDADADTGTPMWTVQIASPEDDYSITGAPRVISATSRLSSVPTNTLPS